MMLLCRTMLLQFATSSLPAFTRLGTAAFVGDGVENFKRPEKMLELYEFQGQHLRVYVSINSRLWCCEINWHLYLCSPQ